MGISERLIRRITVITTTLTPASKLSAEVLGGYHMFHFDAIGAGHLFTHLVSASCQIWFVALTDRTATVLIKPVILIDLPNMTPGTVPARGVIDCLGQAAEDHRQR